MSKNAFLVASLTLNIGLLALGLIRNRHTDRESAPVGFRAQGSQSNPLPPFNWSRLESPDYPTYIENLRRVGCPELTVREIISADLDDLFSLRRQVLVAKLAGGTSTLEERNLVEIGLRKLRQEQVSVYDRLF